MRQRRVRGRFLAILVFLFVAACLVVVEDRLQMLAPGLKVIAERKIAAMMKGGGEVSIGAIRGGIFRDLELDNIRIRPRDGGTGAPFFKIDNVRVDFRVWDLISGKRSRDIVAPIVRVSVGPDGQYSIGPHMVVRLSAMNGELNGHIKLEGGPASARAEGVIVFFGENIPFKGNFTFDGERLTLERFSVRGVLISRGVIDLRKRTVDIEAQCNHLTVDGADVVCAARFSGSYERADSSGPSFTGELIAKNLIINQRPFGDVRASFGVRGRVLSIANFSMGSQIRMKGDISLQGPLYPVDLSIVVDNLNITEVLVNVRYRDVAFVSGFLSAKATVKGPVRKPDVRCALEVHRGNIGDLSFNSLTATLAGMGPIVTIDEARINREHGHLTVTGDLDLRDVGRPNLFENIQMFTDDKNLVWNGWDISKETSSAEVWAVANMTDDAGIAFKTYMEDERVDPRDRQSEFEVEYKIFDNHALKMRFGEDTEFVGLEHKEKF